MPKIKQLEQCKHPNSRKTKVLAKNIKKQSKKEKRKLSTYIKQNLLGEKLVWFRDHLNSSQQDKCTPSDVEQLILEYLGRFDDELEQIKLKHSVGQRKNQHASREAVINMTLKREREEFKTCGIELPDMLNDNQLKQLKMWSGELRYLQNFKLKRFSMQHLKEEKDKGF